MELCDLSLHLHVCKLCFANLIDQLGVANFAYTLGSADLVYNLKHRFAYVFFSQSQFYNVGLQTEFCNFSLHIFVLQTLLGNLIWGEPAM